MLHLHLHTLVLSLALVPPAASTPPATAPPSVTEARETEQSSAHPPDPLFIHLELDLAKLPAEDAPYFERDIRAAIEPLLAHEPVVLADDAAHRLVIHVALLDPDALDYATDFELIADGSPIAPPVDRLHCRMCAQIEVIEQLAHGFPRALAALRDAVQPVPTATVPAEPLVLPEPSSLIAVSIEASQSPEPTEPSEAPRFAPPRSIPPTPSPRIRWLGPVGAIGIVLAIGGTSTVAVGTTALYQAHAHTPEPIFELPSFSRDPDGTAWLLYGTGLVVTAIGGAMLAADVTTLRKRRARRLASRASLAPGLTGLLVHGRF